MADPVGASTFAQMFSPTKSPFHAINLAGLACLYPVRNHVLAGYGVGILLLILTASSCVAPFFRPKYDDTGYNVSFMVARSTGLIGGMIALSVLITGSGQIAEADTEKLLSSSYMFKLIWVVCIGFIGYSAFLFLLKAKPARGTEKQKRFNVTQFFLIQSVMIIAISFFAVSSNKYTVSSLRDVAGGAFDALRRSPSQLVTSIEIQKDNIVYFLICLWLFSAVLNSLLFLKELAIGWMDDHGEGVTS